jgi:glucan biosynthesis protein C
MRKYYIDNLRWIVILLLFPIHTAVLYFPKGTQSFIFNSILENPISLFLFLAITPTLMGMLFLIAGMSTRYSLARRSYGEYLSERVKKLLIPFFTGILTVIPFMYYIFNLETGESKGFIPFMNFYLSDVGAMPSKIQHLWFLLCLFIVSILALIFIVPARRNKFAISPKKIAAPRIILLGIIFILLGKFLNFGSTVTLSGAFILLLIGYFFFGDDAVKEKIMTKGWLFLGIFVVLSIGNIILYNQGYQTGYGISNYKVTWLFPYYGMMTQWVGILALLSLGEKYLEFNNKFTKYMSEASFAIYIFHYPSLLLSAYIFAPFVQNQPLQFLIIIAVGFLFCILIYEVIRRIPGLRFIFGIPKKKISMK